MKDIRKTQEEATDDPVSLARRRLLKAGAYVPPAVVGMMLAGQSSAWAARGKHKNPSCNPCSCGPCYKTGEKNRKKCEKKRRKCANKNGG